MEDSENSSDDSDAEQWENFDFKAGIMDLVRQALQGMASRNTDEGVKAMGRHARTIRLGRSLWGSPALESNVSRLIEERFFDDGIFPPRRTAFPLPRQNLAFRCAHHHCLRPSIIVMVG